MPILNYTTRVPAKVTAQQLQAILAEKGATEVQTMYEANRPTGIRFSIETKNGMLRFALPVDVDRTYQVLTNQGVLVKDAARRREQAERTSWRIVRTWVMAQLAIIETEMVQLDQVFLPYMLAGDQTLYEYLDDGGMQKLLAAPE